ncbi:MAG TPA: hypothetical protein VM871_01285 [Flavisolibacter sp.]|nr:hypothetical protein [Flavisolibacter sp.]
MRKTIFLNGSGRTETATTNVKPNRIGLRNATLLTMALGLLLSTGCKKDDNDRKPVDVPDRYTGLSQKTVQELKEVRTATSRYKDIQNAVADGYDDISVVVEHMGFHYMKASLADTIFDYRKPEILVYNKNNEGKVELVAVEYAVPISLRPNSAPEGFTGSTDVWKRDTGFGLWLLHAWVWEYNPDGVFNPTNPSIHLHQ